MSVRMQIAIVMLWGVTAIAIPSFSSPGVLFEALASDSTLADAELEVHGQLVADFFRDAYMQALPTVQGENASSGLHLRTNEHLAEVGDFICARGTLVLDKGEIHLKASAIELLARSFDPPVIQFVRIQDLNENAMLYRDRMVELQDLKVERFLRDATGVPWLAICRQGELTLDVELRDGGHPVLLEDMRIDRMRGIFRRSREHWRLVPRTGDDYLIRPELKKCVSDLIITGYRNAPLLLDEICYDPFEAGEGEGAESFAVVNMGAGDIDLSGWRVSDGEGEWIFPEGSILGIGERFRVARKKERYFFEFGRDCDFSFDRDPAPADSCLILANDGDELMLLDPDGALADRVDFEMSSDLPAGGWEGPALRPFRFTNYVPEEGAILLRKRDPESGALIDSDRRSDWICDPDDAVWGRRLAFPGWDRDLFFDTASCEETAEIRAYVSPEHSFDGLVDFLRSAERSLEIEMYLITHPLVVDEFIAALDRGVEVTVLLEGEVFGARGGTYDSVRGLMRRVVEHPSENGQVFFWRNGDDPRHTGPDTDIPDRYNHVHQKFVLADRTRLLVSSDNFTQSSMPADPKHNGTGGSRGVILVTDATCAVERAVKVWEADCDPWRQRDIRQFIPHPKLSESIPKASGDRKNYQSLIDAPYVSRESAVFELSQSPENSLRPDRGYLGLINRTGAGDWIFVEQQYERPHWGYAEYRTPNPRLEAYLDAARRGARVRILLSGSRTTPKSETTRDYVGGIAEEENLDIEVLLGWMPRTPKRRDPIHNKMMLVRVGDEHWSHVGSANGSATASLYNREMGLSIRSNGLHDYLLEVFATDWIRAGGDESDLP
jgi:phosphatidylserine/phosphatidylglycerophosphate/cardiolipin synthase-like enzyme